MRLSFHELPDHERRLYFEQAAARRGLSAVVLEKDFWVCWLLGVLFRSEFRESLVFKGGTSLSKVFQVIERFSEDIDLSVSPALLGLPEPGTSRNPADKWMTLAEAACAKAVQEQFQPTLEAEAKTVLGKPERGAWFEYAADPTSGAPNLLFHYPSHQPTGFDYLRRSVRLELGSLTDQQPVGRHAITPWLLDALPDAMPDWQCDVVALGIDRTFWEKATILHAEHHRPADKGTPDRFSRHYADVAALARHPRRKAQSQTSKPASGSWAGNGCSSAVRGRTTKPHGPAHFTCCPAMSDCRPCVATSRRCETCTSRSPRPCPSMRCSRHCRPWNAGSTSPATFDG